MKKRLDRTQLEKLAKLLSQKFQIATAAFFAVNA